MFFTDRNVVEPDVLFVAKDRVAIVEDRFVRSAPDVVVEVSSPSTRRLELRRKRELYERFGVAEYWYMDLDADRVEVYRLNDEGRYTVPAILEAADTLMSDVLPGFAVEVEELLGLTGG